MKELNFIKIGNRKIGSSFRPLIIFELGINHNGSLKLAKKIVDDAIKAGAEIIKHQTHIPHLRGVPCSDILIEHGRLRKHPIHIRHIRGVPTSDIIIEC